MKQVKIIFDNSKYNYIVNVNITCKDKSLYNFYVGSTFNIDDTMQTCIDIEYL